MPKKAKTLKRSESEEEEEKYLMDAAAEDEYIDHEYLQEDEYNVESIEDMKVENGKKVYLIKWDGFPHSQNTWEPIEHLTKVLYMVEQFEENYALKKSMQENKFSHGMRDDSEDSVHLKKKKTKKMEISSPEEVIIKKRKLDSSEKGNQLYEKRIVGVESPIGESSGPNEDEGIMEISYNKENFEQPEKKRLMKNIFEREAPIEEDFSLPKETSFADFDSKLFNDSVFNDDPFRFLQKDVPEKDNVFSIEKDIVNFDVSKDITTPPEISTSTPVETKTVPTKSLKAILQKKQQKKVDSNFSSKSLPKKKDKIGSFKNKDKPNAILSIKPGKDSGLLFLVEWQRRKEGLFPENSYVTSEEMKLNDPYFLIDFYESKLVRKQKHKKKNKDKENKNQNKMEIEKVSENVQKEQNLNTETSQGPNIQASPVAENPRSEEQAASLNDSNLKDKMLEDLENEITSFEGNLDENHEVLEEREKEKAATEGFGSAEKATESSENGGNENRDGGVQGNKEAQGSLVSVGS